MATRHINVLDLLAGALDGAVERVVGSVSEVCEDGRTTFSERKHERHFHMTQTIHTASLRKSADTIGAPNAFANVYNDTIPFDSAVVT